MIIFFTLDYYCNYSEPIKLFKNNPTFQNYTRNNRFNRLLWHHSIYFLHKTCCLLTELTAGRGVFAHTAGCGRKCR